jgi:serine/threonine protein kinase
MHPDNVKFFPDDEDKDFEKVAEEVKQILIDLTTSFLKDPRHLLGFGNIAEVHFHPDNQNICIKIISKETINRDADQQYCSLSEEAKFLEDVRRIKGTGARSPRPIMSAVLKDKIGYGEEDVGLQILVMERLKAVTLESILEDIESFPPNFDVDSFFSKLNKFVQNIHDNASVYHRDLRERNIMVGEQGEPYVIDYGSAIKATNEEDSWPTNIYGQYKRIPSDEAMLSTVERKVRKKLGLTI